MSMKPLDLQTLFIKMAQVGKEQSAIQKSVENQQNREAKILVKEEMDREHSVNKSEEDKNIEGVKDDRTGNKGNFSGKKDKRRKDKESEEKLNYFSDPNRGHNLDISG